MKVKDLIKELEQMPPDAVVCHANTYSGPTVTESAGVSLEVWHPEEQSHTPHFDDDDIEDGQLAVLVWPEDPEDYEPPTIERDDGTHSSAHQPKPPKRSEVTIDDLRRLESIANDLSKRIDRFGDALILLNKMIENLHERIAYDHERLDSLERRVGEFMP